MNATKILETLKTERGGIDNFIAALAELQKMNKRDPPPGKKDEWIKGLGEVLEQIDRCILAGEALLSGKKRRGRPPGKKTALQTKSQSE